VRVRAAFVVALCLFVAGCGGRPKPSPQRPNPPKQSPTAGRPSPTAPMAFGVKTTLGGTVEAAVLAYRQPSVTGGPAVGPSGYTWGSADVQVCTLSSAKSTVTVNWKAWSLRYDDNSVVPASDKNSDAFPRPEYPFTDYVVAAGQCVRGWITFSVPGDGRPKSVEYAPRGFVAQWTVPSAGPSPSAS
jgi:hypothetical protein